MNNSWLLVLGPGRLLYHTAPLNAASYRDPDGLESLTVAYPVSHDTSAVKLTSQGKLEELESKALDSASDCAGCDRWVSMRDPISLKGLGVSNSDEISTDL